MGLGDHRVALRCHRRSHGHPTVCLFLSISTSFHTVSDCSQQQGPSSSSSLGPCSSSTTYNPSCEQQLATVGWVLRLSWASFLSSPCPCTCFIVVLSWSSCHRSVILLLPHLVRHRAPAAYPMSRGLQQCGRYWAGFVVLSSSSAVLVRT